MAKYELGAIYKINGRNGELYYVRLLTNECYGVFSSLEGELNEETFAQTHYRLYFSCNSFPIKRGIWGKVVSSPMPDCCYISGRKLSLIVNGCKPLTTHCTV